jgi:hypothetical protein
VPSIRRSAGAALIVAVSASLLLPREAAARSPVMASPVTVSTGTPEGAGQRGDSCGCRSVQRPPWHANVAVPACGPSCRQHGTMFHADPHGQLCIRRQLHETGATMPSLFPRLNILCTEGYLPTPRPPALPRCHHCGALIEPGF